jgi:hypothetical protein
LTEYHEHKLASKHPAPPRAADDEKTSASGSKRQRLLTVFDKQSASVITQQKVDELVINYIIEEVRPLRTVEKPAFKALVEGLSPSHTVLCRKTLSKRLSEKNTALLFDIRQQLVGLPAVCTTADLWSCLKKSYMGVTAHWITCDLKRRSVALACRRVKGSHTYDVVAEHIMNIHSEFGLDHTNISFTVTDNGSNMVKAFVEYQKTDEPNGDKNDEASGAGQSDDDLEDSNDSAGQVAHADLQDILTSTDSSNDIFLPKHMRCSSHTLNLLGTNDFQKIVTEDGGTFKRLIRSALAKCGQLWNNVSRSTKSSDVVEQIIGLSLRTPGETRWNATYDAIKRLMEPRVRDNLTNIMDKLEMTRFQKIELDVLEEYLKIMAPIATALDKLQGESNCYIGLLMPTIQQVKKKLLMVEATVEHSGPLIDGLVRSLERRFAHLFEYNNSSQMFVVAAMCHPNFKLRWVPADKKDWAKSAFLTEAKKCSETAGATTTLSSSAAVESDDFFQFEDDEHSNVTHMESSTKVTFKKCRITCSMFSLCNLFFKLCRISFVTIMLQSFNLNYNKRIKM